MKVQNPTRRIVWMLWQKTRPGKHLLTDVLAARIVEYIWSFLILLNAKEFCQQNSLSKRQRNTQTTPKIQWTWATLETRKLTSKKLTIHHFCCFNKWILSRDRILVEVIFMSSYFYDGGSFCLILIVSSSLFFCLPFFALFFIFLPNLLLKI